jgi:hypothetical protein
MNREIEEVREKLKGLGEQIDREEYRKTKPHGQGGWGGAGVIFTRDEPARRGETSYYPEPRYVVTPYADDAAWLLHKLRDLFSYAGLIDSLSKIEFFGRLATAAVRYQQKAGKGETPTGLLDAMLREAEVMLGKMEKGTFRSRALERKNAVAEDLEI